MSCYDFHNMKNDIMKEYINDNIRLVPRYCEDCDDGIEHGLSALAGSPVESPLPNEGFSTRLWSALRRIFRAWGV